jgi:uncharacterized protein YegP (UPF0339 family)
MKKAHYQIHHNEKGFYFLLVAANNKTVGGSFNEYYDTKAGCKRGILDHHITSESTNKTYLPGDLKELQDPIMQRAILKQLRIVDKTKFHPKNNK